MKTLESALALALVDGVGPVVYARMVNAFGSAEAALAAPEARLAELEGLGPERARRIVAGRAKAGELARRELAIAKDHGVRILSAADPDFPAALRYMHDTPPILYVKGELRPADRLAVAIVGTRHCSYYGRAQAELLAAGLAQRGFTIVSGLARGIDAAAHEGALSAGGRTIAVLGNGLSSIYPPEHAELARKVAASGALVSEFPLLTAPAPENFPRRNRIISALALGVIVVEGDERSGAMITAAHARDQGREVLAVPGKVDNPGSRGPHRLIRAGAALVEDVADVLQALGPLADGLLGPTPPAAESGEGRGEEPSPFGRGQDEELPPASAEGGEPRPPRPSRPSSGQGEGAAAPPEKGRSRRAAPAAAADVPAGAFAPAGGAAPIGLNRQERLIYDLLSSDPKPVDQLIAESNLAPQEVSSTLMILEIKRVCKRLAGERFVRG